MTEEQQETPTTEEKAEEESTPQEVVEIPWEEIAPLVALRQRLARVEREISTILLEQEKRKVSFMQHISALETALIEKAKELQGAKGLDNSETYELKFPSSENEKGYFVRKES